MALRVRTPSPTRVLWDNRRKASKCIQQMVQNGLHVFHPEWAVYHSPTFTECTLQVYGSDESITLPVQTCTKVRDVKMVIGYKAQCNPEDLIFVVKQGCHWRVQNDHQEVGRRVTVRGVKSFKPSKMTWPHPYAIVGAGYNGIKTAIFHLHTGSSNFVMFERYDRVGGHAWITQANKTSKLQTEMAAFHLWFGPPWDDSNEWGLGYPTDWETWPKKDQILAHIQHAAEKYGVFPHIRFQTDVVQMDTVGKDNDFWRSYDLVVQPKVKNQQEYHMQASAIYHFPGAYFAKRIIEYPGEENFGGQVGYGMNDDIPFDHLEGSRAAIIGNGAFGVENIRTCCEYGVDKVFMVCRKKNLPSPRLCCWFVHANLIPVPASMVLNTFKPMFEDCGFGDPWDYHSVYASKDRKNCTIISHSRFGIGDVTFLAVAWGRCEYVTDQVKRFTYHTLHLESGKRLDNVTNVIKALGLIGDWGADRMHKIKQLVGQWPNGDYRRMVFADPLGMNAANFTTFSTGIGSYCQQQKDKWALDYPGDMEYVLNSGVKEMLPTNKADIAADRPAHQYDAKYQMMSAMVMEGSCPKMAMTCAGVDDYKHRVMMAVNPLPKYFAECKASWDQYQEDWLKAGFKHEWVPYPYTMDTVKEWFDEYRRTVGPTSLAEKEAQANNAEEDSTEVQWDTKGNLEWWKENCGGGWQVKPAHGLGGGG